MRGMSTAEKWKTDIMLILCVKCQLISHRTETLNPQKDPNKVVINCSLLLPPLNLEKCSQVMY